MMVASAVVLAGVMIGVMPMGVVRCRLRMGSIATAEVLPDVDRGAAKATTGAKAKTTTVNRRFALRFAR